ncbi:hypothetical protein [Pseudonocardia sp. NPDC049635]|uniref:hypothetical protein n=1 Tax=Pseudonocardia sp. NPDC049635 TaxID=3155506 RepID=UPI0033C737E0
MLDALLRAAGITAGDDTAPRPVPNRADHRRAGRRGTTGGPRPVNRPGPLPRHPLARRDDWTAADRAAAARLDAAHAANAALPADEQEPWISPAVEQGYRDRRAHRKAQRAARRATRAAR